MKRMLVIVAAMALVLPAGISRADKPTDTASQPTAQSAPVTQTASTSTSMTATPSTAASTSAATTTAAASSTPAKASTTTSTASDSAKPADSSKTPSGQAASSTPSKSAPETTYPCTFACQHCGMKITLKTPADLKKICDACACGMTCKDCRPKPTSK